ncbi:hypothetical protein ABVK25_012204 [Lepraria finkii]|uniref:Uncharacterized protein n=1 Tax=Lepraria finkii TaxID=1340010 RepID=A0ABR4AJ06_9LECA
MAGDARRGASRRRSPNARSAISGPPERRSVTQGRARSRRRSGRFRRLRCARQNAHRRRAGGGSDPRVTTRPPVGAAPARRVRRAPRATPPAPTRRSPGRRPGGRRPTAESARAGGARDVSVPRRPVTAPSASARGHARDGGRRATTRTIARRGRARSARGDASDRARSRGGRRAAPRGGRAGASPPPSADALTGRHAAQRGGARARGAGGRSRRTARRPPAAAGRGGRTAARRTHDPVRGRRRRRLDSPRSRGRGGAAGRTSSAAACAIGPARPKPRPAGAVAPVDRDAGTSAEPRGDPARRTARPAGAVRRHAVGPIDGATSTSIPRPDRDPRPARRVRTRAGRPPTRDPHPVARGGVDATRARDARRGVDGQPQPRDRRTTRTIVQAMRVGGTPTRRARAATPTDVPRCSRDRRRRGRRGRRPEPGTDRRARRDRPGRASAVAARPAAVRAPGGRRGDASAPADRRARAAADRTQPSVLGGPRAGGPRGPARPGPPGVSPLCGVAGRADARIATALAVAGPDRAGGSRPEEPSQRRAPCLRSRLDAPHR